MTFKRYFRELAEVRINQTAQHFNEVRRQMQENSVRVIVYHLRKFIKAKKAKLEAAKLKKQKKGTRNNKKLPTYGNKGVKNQAMVVS